MGFLGGSDGKESACITGDLGSIPGSGISPGGGNDNPLQYTCLENTTDRGVWRATVHRSFEESDVTISNTHVVEVSLTKESSGTCVSISI